MPSLLDLPTEIRLQIFTYVLVPEKCYERPCKEHTTYSRTPGPEERDKRDKGVPAVLYGPRHGRYYYCSDHSCRHIFGAGALCYDAYEGRNHAQYICPSLLYVCSAIRQEALEVFYGFNKFYYLFRDRPACPGNQYIRHLRLITALGWDEVPDALHWQTMYEPVIDWLRSFENVETIQFNLGQHTTDEFMNEHIVEQAGLFDQLTDECFEMIRGRLEEWKAFNHREEPDWEYYYDVSFCLIPAFMRRTNPASS